MATNDTITFQNFTQTGQPFFEQRTVPTIYKLNKDTGDEIDDFRILIQGQGGQGQGGQGQGGPPQTLLDPIGAMASDGQHLYVGVLGTEGIQAAWFKVDPANPNFVAERIDEFEGLLPRMPGFNAFEIVTISEFPTDRQLIASGDVSGGSTADTIARFDRAQGTMHPETSNGATNGQFKFTGKDIKGLAYFTSTKSLFIADDATDKIFQTKLPENTGIELTTIGNYQAELSATVNPTYTSSPVAYSIVKNTELLLELATPIQNFTATSSQVVLSGRVNDPSITSLVVDLTLPFTKFVDDPVPSAASLNEMAVPASAGTAIWHIACEGASQGYPNQPRNNTTPCSWRYGNPGGPSFDTNDVTTGTLETSNVFFVSSDTRLKFFTAYDTEVAPNKDIKMVEVANVSTDLQGNQIVGNFQPLIQIVGRGGAASPFPANTAQGFKFIELDPLFVNPNLVLVDEPLGQFTGQSIKLRYRFDSVDRFANGGEGWYIDDIEVSGSGVQVVQVNTSPIGSAGEACTIGTTSTTCFRSFSQALTLSEGFNTVGAAANQSYSPFLDAFELRNGFVDTIAPVITLFGLPTASNVISQTVQGTISDNTLQELRISQIVGTSTQVLQTFTAVPQGGTFQVPFTLTEGVNTIEAFAEDAGLKQTTITIATIGDFTPPTAQIKVVTVASEGEAVAGDQYFVAVAVQDSLSGVGDVLDSATGDVLEPIADVPDILVEMHGLGTVNPTTTHIQLASVQAGTRVGVNTLNFTVLDQAGNSIPASAVLNVVSSRTNRNYFLFPGVHFMGLALIPDDDDAGTTDDASLDRLMAQDISDRVSKAFKTHQGTSTIVLGDVVESTFAFNRAGNFIVHTPGPAADTLTDMAPFQGMNVNTKETAGTSTPVDVFKKVSVAGFSAQQAVPIRVNIQGVFFRQGQLPPDKELRVGYNLIAPQILGDTLFDTVYRGALIPRQLAVSALAFERRVDAVVDSDGISAEIFEGFVANTLGDILKPVVSYWTFIADDPLDNRVNDLGDPLGPTITP